MSEPTLVAMHHQNGYGAHKRNEHCEVCYETTGKVGTWKLTFSDGTVRYFCDDHVPSIQPIDHLAGQTGLTVELLEALTDEQLAEQLAYHTTTAKHLRENPTDPTVSVYRSSSYAAWRYGRWAGMARHEQKRRAHRP